MLRHHALTRARAQDGEPLPGAERGGGGGALAPRRAGMRAGHRSRDAAFVDKDQLVGADLGYLLARGLAFGRDLGPILLGRPERLFWRVSFRRLSALHRTGLLPRTPVRSAKRPASSQRVA